MKFLADDPQQGREGRRPILLVSGRQGGRDGELSSRLGPNEPRSGQAWKLLAFQGPALLPAPAGKVPSLDSSQGAGEVQHDSSQGLCVFKRGHLERVIHDLLGNFRGCREAFLEHLRAYLTGGCPGAQRVPVLILKAESASRKSTQHIARAWCICQQRVMPWQALPPPAPPAHSECAPASSRRFLAQLSLHGEGARRASRD